LFIRFMAAAALAGAIAIPTVAGAQSTPVPLAPGAAAPQVRHHGHHGALRTALNGLGLSAGQRSQIDQAFAQARVANKGADKATRRADRTKLRAQIDAILTPAQRAQLKTTLQQERRNRPAA